MTDVSSVVTFCTNCVGCWNRAVSHLDVQSGEVAVEVLRVIDVWLPTHWTHHVSDVFVPHSNGEVLLKAAAAH